MELIPLKTPHQIKTMRAGGQITALILDQLFRSVRSGVTTRQLEEQADQLLRQHPVKPAFKDFEGYRYNLVTCVNEEVVHGIPSPRALEDGDLLTIDFGTIYQGWYTDMARTQIVGSAKSDRKQFLEVGRTALDRAIQECRPGRRIGDIGHAIQSTIESAGYGVVRMYVGHGVGKIMHEPPQIPGFGLPHHGPELKTGMVLAVEVMYTMGDYRLEILDDGWTAVTKDRSLSAMFEHTVAVTDAGPQVLTTS